VSEPSKEALEAADWLRAQPLSQRGHYHQVAELLDRFASERAASGDWQQGYEAAKKAAADVAEAGLVRVDLGGDVHHVPANWFARGLVLDIRDNILALTAGSKPAPDLIRGPAPSVDEITAADDGSGFAAQDHLAGSSPALTERARAFVNDAGPLYSPSPWHIVGSLDAAAQAIAAFAQSEREAAAAEARRAAIEECAQQVGSGRWMCSENCEGPQRIRALASPAPQERTMNDDQIKHMVQRFLSWPLPKDFSPDGGISAKRPNYAPEIEWTPSGTNLLTATQAEAMVRYMLEGCP